MKEKLFTSNYCRIVAANFLLYFGFWLLTPTLPFYLTENFGIGTSTAGLIISCYTISALCIRPFTGYLLDSFERKPLYLCAYFLFMSIFFGYMVAGHLFLFAMLRIAHGLSFGMVTVGGNTMVVDIMPEKRRGEGLGYYGMANNIAMATGPMVGLLMHNNGFEYATIFACGFASSSIGFCLASGMKPGETKKHERQALNLGNIILRNGIPAGIALMLLAIPYGMTTNYVAMYAKEIGIDKGTGIFFTVIATGMALSRIIAGRYVDKGYICEVISSGFVAVIASFASIAMLETVSDHNMTLCTAMFFATPLFLGVGFGVMFPAYNTVFVNLAPDNQRGVATSTYLTSWDIGLGIGIVAGGRMAESYGFETAYMAGTAITLISAIYFNKKVTPHFAKNRVK